MNIDLNSLIAQRVIRMGLADQNQVLNALAAFSSGLAGNNLGESMVNLGLLTARQMEKVIQSLRGTPWEENQALLEFLRRFPLPQLDLSALEQAYNFALQNRISLGQALVKTRHISVKDFVQLRDRLREDALVCPKCQIPYLPPPPDSPILCACGEILIPTYRKTAFAPKQENATQKFGKYEILSEISRGGMGVVFLARQIGQEKKLALKVLLDQEGASEVTLKRFEKEAKTAQKLTHPNIVGILDYGEIQGIPYIAMEFIEGESLREIIEKQKKFPYQKALSIMREIALAMHYAHEQNIIHRDLKAANVMLDSQGKPCITDFGLAKDLDSDTMLTQSGIKIGTPSYMAPEQAQGKSKYAGPLTDIYQLGVMLFHLLTGELPYKAKTPAELFYKIIYEDPPDPCQIAPELPKEMTYLCQKAMAKDPEQRYSKAKLMAEDIEKVLRGESLGNISKESSKLKKLEGKKAGSTTSLRHRQFHTSSLKRKGNQNKNIVLFWALGIVFLIFLFLVFYWISFTEKNKKTKSSFIQLFHNFGDERSI